MHRGFFRTAVILLLPVSALLGACEETGVHVLELGILLDEINATKIEELQTSDPIVRAAIEASNIPARVEAAEMLLVQGMTTRDVSLIDEAITFRPVDPRYRMDKAALLIAQGKPFTDAAAQGVGAIEYSYANASEEEKARIFYKTFLDSLFSAFRYFTLDTEGERLRAQYCSTVAVFKARFPADAAALIGGTC